MIKLLYRKLPLRLRTIIYHRVLRKGCSDPEEIFVEQLVLMKQKREGPLRLAEVGVDKGSTTRAVLEHLNSDDTMDLYDRSSAPLFKDKRQVLSLGLNVKFFENSCRLFDNYAWTIVKQIEHDNHGMIVPKYDLVFIDGAHTFTIDFCATSLMKELIKPGGVIILSDLNWTIRNSPSVNTRFMRKSFTNEQLKEPHVALIVKNCLESDNRFIRLDSTDPESALFQRKN